jgi:hypothetical protein
MHQQDQEEREHDRTIHLSGTIEHSVRAGASRKIDELVAGYGATRVMLVTDKGVRGAGLTKGAENPRWRRPASRSAFSTMSCTKTQTIGPH